MKILIIGGTKFLGRHLIAAAQSRDHEITLFNRGKHSNENFVGVEQIQGDRHSDLNKLNNRVWDAVIDTCGYLPQSVKISAEALKDSVNRYVFISSISAYADYRLPNFDETAPTAELNEEQLKKVGEIDPKGDLTGASLGEMYGALKVLCEREAEKAMPDRVLQVRSGLIVGSFDPTDRFTYWVMRVARGGEVLAPGDPRRFVQLIDARDLSEWIIKAVEQNLNGIYNVTGKPFELSMQSMLEEIKNVSGSGDAHFTWASEEFLNEEKVAAWSEMPLYLPESSEEFKGFLAANVDKALQTGLSFRPLRETIQDTFDWRKTKPDEPLKAGIDADRETLLLRKCRERQ
jgi:2'-hydroxyisoflavone reductase